MAPRPPPRAPRLLPAALLAAFVLAPPLHVEAQATGTVRIAELLVDPETGRPEFVELWNAGNTTVELAGWKVQDRVTTPSTFTFTSWTLAPGARVVVWSGTNATDTPEGPKWRTTTVWNNAGDAAVLIDPAGAVLDYVPYGSGGGTPPTGFESVANLPAPARGKSLALHNGTWSEGAPTPGLAPGATGASLSFTVANVAPSAHLALPPHVLPGSSVEARPTASDDNGFADLASWTLRSGSTLLASGQGVPPSSVQLRAPDALGTWTVTLAVTDGGGLTANSTAAATVRAGTLAVVMPASGTLRFPELRPGAGDVLALDTFTLRNDDIVARAPRIDVSDFRGSAGTVPVAGNLWIGVESGNATAWQAYGGPLTALPSLEPGAQATVHLKLAALPVPLAAGTYGTTFAVVA